MQIKLTVLINKDDLESPQYLFECLQSYGVICLPLNSASYWNLIIDDNAASERMSDLSIN